MLTKWRWDGIIAKRSWETRPTAESEREQKAQKIQHLCGVDESQQLSGNWKRRLPRNRNPGSLRSKLEAVREAKRRGPWKLNNEKKKKKQVTRIRKNNRDWFCDNPNQFTRIRKDSKDKSAMRWRQESKDSRAEQKLWKRLKPKERSFGINTIF